MIDWSKKITKLFSDDFDVYESPGKMRASSVGYCPRQMYLGKIGVKDFNDYVKGAMQVGTLIHEAIEEEFDEEFRFEERIEFEENGIRFTGHFDCFDGETVYDFKTTSSLKYVRSEPKSTHVQQLHVYMRGLGVEKGCIVYIGKKGMQVVQHEVEFSDELWSDIKLKVGKVLDVLDYDSLPRSSEEVPFGSCGCYYCRSERLDFGKVDDIIRKGDQ